MPSSTTRLALPYPKADRSDPFTVAEDLGALAARIDVVAAMAEQGTFAARPAAGTARRLYFATDTATLYYDTGAAWVTVNPPQPSYWWPGDVKATAAFYTGADWKLCDGSALGRSAWANLFGAIGTTYGAGDGSTTFNLPDYRGKSLFGHGANGVTVGANGGQRFVTLVESQMPRHQHTLGGVIVSATPSQAGSGAPILAITPGTGSTDYTGNDQQHENMPPWAGVYVYIKT